MKLAYNPEDLDEMLLVEQMLKQEVNFAISIKDWPRVSVFKRKLKVCGQKIVNLRLAPQMAA